MSHQVHQVHKRNILGMSEILKHYVPADSIYILKL